MNIKICTKCKQELTFDKFAKAKKGKFGIEAVCKECKKMYTRSVDGLVRELFNQQKKSSKHRNQVGTVEYTLEELQSWCKGQKEFKNLYDNWVKSDYNTKLRPSIDRLDDYKGYSFDNIQLMTWIENKQKGHDSRKNGSNNKDSKAVVQLDMDGNFIAEFYSQKEAMRQTGINHARISKVCRGDCTTNPVGKQYKSLSTGGFKWMFKTEYDSLNPNNL